MTYIIFAAAALLFAKSPLSLLLAVLAHEAGHIIYAQFRKMGRPSFSVTPAGLHLTYSGVISYKDNIFLCLSGPLTSILLFFAARGTLFSLYSLGLGAVNLIPVSLFDGGGALRCTALMLFPYEKALSLCRTVSVICVILLTVFNILIQMKIGFNVTLIAVSLYTAVTVLSQ